MKGDIRSLHSSILSVIAKERELVQMGYQEKKLDDEQQLDSGEYFVRLPDYGNHAALQGWENMSIIWRSS